MLRIKEQIQKNFKPFEFEINNYSLYEIYPANKIATYNCSN